MINRLSENYAQVSNKVLWDKTISSKAKGLYAYLCSKSDAWKFSYTSITKEMGEGEKTIRASVKELVERGVVVRISRKTKGKYAGWEWIVNPTKEDIENNNDPFVKNGKNRKCQKTEVPVTGSTKNGEEYSNTVPSNTVPSNTVTETSLTGDSVQKEYGNEEINSFLKFLQKAVGVSDFTNSQRWQRIYSGHMMNLITGTKTRPGIGKEEFLSRLKYILGHKYKAERANDLKFLYNEIKAYIHTPIVSPQPTKVGIYRKPGFDD